MNGRHAFWPQLSRSPTAACGGRARGRRLAAAACARRAPGALRQHPVSCATAASRPVKSARCQPIAPRSVASQGEPAIACYCGSSNAGIGLGGGATERGGLAARRRNRAKHQIAQLHGPQHGRRTRSEARRKQSSKRRRRGGHRPRYPRRPYHKRRVVQPALAVFCVAMARARPKRCCNATANDAPIKAWAAPVATKRRRRRPRSGLRAACLGTQRPCSARSTSC